MASLAFSALALSTARSQKHTRADTKFLSVKLSPSEKAHNSAALLRTASINSRCFVFSNLFSSSASAFYGRKRPEFVMIPNDAINRPALYTSPCAEMFDDLAAGFANVIKTIGNRTLTSDNIQDALKEVRTALLDADVNLDVAKSFVAEVERNALGTKVVKGVTPQQMFIKCVNDQLVEVMGGEMVPIAEARRGEPTIILLAGLQGVGKTTAAAKLANYLKNQGKSPLLVASDVYRPAAIEQLVLLGAQIGVPVFELGGNVSPVEIARKGVEHATSVKADVVIVDTAGRLTVDDDMMEELEKVKRVLMPTETLLVVDAMTGQEAAKLTRTFNDRIGISGAILTKFDGDTRGGAALSVRQVSGKPIKFIGVGEGMDNLEPFYPDRMASRILGMGDVVSLVERAQRQMSEDDLKRIMMRIADDTYDFNDFLTQMRVLRGLGSVSGFLKYLPAKFNPLAGLSGEQMMKGERNLRIYESMVDSMTDEERATPALLLSGSDAPSRRRRIATEAEVNESEVTRFLKEFTNMKGQMKKMQSSMMAKLGAGQNPLEMPGMPTAVDSKKKQRAPRQKISKAKGF